MTILINSIKNYFANKEYEEQIDLVKNEPCQICWGHSEYDGQYKKMTKK